MNCMVFGTPRIGTFSDFNTGIRHWTKGCPYYIVYNVPDDFRAAVRNENLNALMGISGIGKKTAQRIVLELKDKIDTALYIGNENIFLNDVENDAAAALMSLGYTRKKQ